MVKEGGKTRRAIPHRRAETKNTLIRYERFPTCLTLGPYRYRSVTHGEPECTRARSRALPREYRERRGGYRYPLSPRVISEVRAWHRGWGSVVRRQGCRFHRRKTNVISRAVSPRSEEQPNSAEPISRNVYGEEGIPRSPKTRYGCPFMCIRL